MSMPRGLALAEKGDSPDAGLGIKGEVIETWNNRKKT
jgi:hypothetical protein